MTPQQYCEAEAAPPGSARYYALVNSNERHRPAICTLFALQKVMNDLAAPDMVPDARRAKLGWWLEETGCLLAGRARHPVTRAVSQASLPIERIVGVIRDVVAICSTQEVGTAMGVTRMCSEAGGAVAVLTGEICGATQARSLDAARDIGCGAQMFDSLCLHRQWPAHLTGLASEAKRLLERGDADLPRVDRYRLLPLLTLSCLYLSAIDRLATPSGTASAPGWAPLTRLWKAWRLERRERRGIRP